MSLFSQRKGIRPLNKAIQRESIDEELRNRLWSAITLSVWDYWSPPPAYANWPKEAQIVEQVVNSIWLHYFKKPTDTIPDFNPDYSKSAYRIIRDYFFKAEWWEIYDFIEFILKATPESWSDNLKTVVNSFLEAESAAYRIINKEIIEITDENEIESIESALDKGISAFRSHFLRALELLSDRNKPDYRNSIKESISAVESACQLLADNNKATLSDCLKLLKSNKPLHPAFEQALTKLYGFTNDEGGIRHALTEESERPTYADAKFMLVACSAFTNYLLTRATEIGLKIK